MSFLVVQFRKGVNAQQDSNNNVTRFEKFNFTTPEKQRIVFPISPADVDFLRQKSNSVSVVLPQEDCVGISFTEVKKSLKEKDLYPPPQPEDDAF